MLYKGQAAADGGEHDDDDGGTGEEGSATPSWPGASTSGHAQDETCVPLACVLSCAVLMWRCCWK